MNGGIISTPSLSLNDADAIITTYVHTPVYGDRS